MAGLHRHLLVELGGHILVFVMFNQALLSVYSKGCANIFKISILLLLINSLRPMGVVVVSTGLFLFVYLFGLEKQRWNPI